MTGLVPDGRSAVRLTVVAPLIAATLASAACHTMRPVALADLGALRPTQVWVTRADQSVAVVSGPRAFGDTLVGYVNGQFEEIPAGGLKRISMKRPAPRKTAALIAAGVVGAIAAAYLMTSTGDYRNPADTLDCDDNPEQPGCPGANPP
jgi:hypothetical protein